MIAQPHHPVSDQGVSSIVKSRCGISLILAVVVLMSVTAVRANSLGYALSGGGARGLAHIGILKVLEEHGIKPDYISGTSIGAVIGSLYSMGYSATEVEAIVLSIDWARLTDDTYKRKDIYIGQKRWAPYGNFSLDFTDRWQTSIRTGVIESNRMNLEFARLYAPASPYQDFNELPIPFSAIATNLLTGEEELFDSGSLMQAVRASISVPSVIRPFKIGDEYYIDGGVANNFPMDRVREMGADICIGFKTNSALRTEDKLRNLIDVLDQTINIGMTRAIAGRVDSLCIVLEPPLDEYNARDFERAAEIIAAGEAYARENITYLLLALEMQGYRRNLRYSPSEPLPTEYRLSSIEVEGNRYISDSKILEYLKLYNGSTYTIREIINACHFAWNSQFFSIVYPILVPDGTFYKLTVIVEERERRNLGLNLVYTSEDQLNASAVLRLNNLILKNSSLLAELKLGSNNELNIDYVKNFGEFWGIYYRIFGYVNEHTTYLYNENNYKTDSVNKLEYGVSSGLGFFGGEYLSLESFIFSYRTNLYRDISQNFPLQQDFTVSGFGFKAYHESLDDFYFPRSGLRSLLKLDFSRDRNLSQYIYSKFEGNLDFYRPYNSRLSIAMKLRYGSYFDQPSQALIDPFMIGGSEGYMGYPKYAISGPYYKIYELALSYNPFKRTYLDLGIQALNISDYDDWSLQQDLEISPYLSWGYKSPVGPLKLVIAAPLNDNIQAYFMFGYTTDIFRFSRR